MVGEVQHQRLTFDSFPYKGWLIGGFVRTYTTTRVTSCVTTTSHAQCYYTLLCSTLDVTSPIYYQPCAQLYHCPAACLDQSLGFLNPTICRLSSQGDKYCDKIWQKFCLSFSKLLFCETCESKLTFWSCLWKVKTRDREDLEDLGYPWRSGRAQNLNSTSCLLS